MDAQQTQTLPNSCDSSWKRIALNQAEALHHLAKVVAIQTATPTAPPSGPKWTIRGLIEGIKTGAEGFEVLRKAWLLWRAISLGYIGHSVARWLGLL